jgi:hypothetical protein
MLGDSALGEISLGEIPGPQIPGPIINACAWVDVSVPYCAEVQIVEGCVNVEVQDECPC